MNELQENNNLIADQTYCYKMYEKEKYEYKNLHSITLKCCSLSDFNFKNTILSNSDWDSCQVEKCKYFYLSFENSDITSSYFRNCTFSNVIFKNATATDVVFLNCNFINCDFTHMGLSTSKFRKCNFSNLKLRQGSITLNQFEECQFSSSKIAGNFFFNIFTNSNFPKSKIPQTLIASNYGFSSENLEELSLKNTNLKALQQDYLEQKDVISAAIISLNIEKNYDYSILAGIQVIIEQLKIGILVRAEQLFFFKSIIESLLLQNKISFYTTINVLNSLEEVSKLNNIAAQKSTPYIQQIYGSILEYYHQFIVCLHDKMQETEVKGEIVCLKIIYEKEPAIPICTLIGQLMDGLNMSNDYPIRLKTETGSFIEWIRGYDNILKCLQLLVSILGLGVSLKKNNSSKPVNKQKDKEQNENIFFSNSTQGEQSNSFMVQIPENIIKQLNTISTEADVHKALNVFIINGLNVNNNFQGYNNFNVKDINITFSNTSKNRNSSEY